MLKIKEHFDKIVKAYKQPTTVLVTVVALFIFYNLFFRPSFVIPEINEDVVTHNLKYERENINVTAEKVVERAGKRILHNFSMIDSRNRQIFAGLAEFPNLEQFEGFFSNGVKGSDNETWNFTSGRATYVTLKDDSVMTLDDSVQVHNLKREIDISCDNFRIQNSMKDIYMKGSIEIDSNSNILNGEEAFFSEDSSILEISDSVYVKLDAKFDDQNIEISTQKLEYNLDTNEARSQEAFRIRIGERDVKGEIFLSKDGGFSSPNSVEIVKGEEILNSSMIKFEDSTLYLADVKGNYEGAYIECDYLESGEKGTFLIGNVVFDKDNRKLTCKNVDITDSTILARGDVEVINEKDRIATEKLSIDRNRNLANIERGTILSENKDLSFIDMDFNISQESGALKKLNGGLNDMDIKIADVKFDIQNNKYLFSESVEIRQGEELLLTDRIEGSNNLFWIPALKIKSGETVIDMSDSYYNSEDKTFSTQDLIRGKSGEFLFETIGLTYNTESRRGSGDNPVKVANGDGTFFMNSANLILENRDIILGSPYGKKGETEFKGDRGIYSSDEIFSLKDNVEVNDPSFRAFSNELDYIFEKDILNFRGESFIERGDTLLISQGGEAIVNKNIFSAENAVIIKESDDIMQAGRAELNRDMNIVSATNNVDIDLKNGMDIGAENGRIIFEDGTEEILRAELDSSAYLNRGKINIKSDFIEYDNGLKIEDEQLAYARGNIMIGSLFSEGEIELSGDMAVYQIQREIGRINGNVVITSRYDEFGTVNGRAGEAEYNIKDQEVKLSKRVSITGSKNNVKVLGEDITFNVLTRDVKTEGRAGFAYDIDSSKQQEGIEGEIARTIEEKASRIREVADYLD